MGGVIGNLSHWMVGAKVRQLGPAASSVQAYYPIYAGLALMLLLSLSGLMCLNPIRKREGLKAGMVEPNSVALTS
jgi:predicted lysophospholipase L1 biosynthesis ABC-type transport system permease subunit